MTHEEKASRWLDPLRNRRDLSPQARDFGVEIGAFKTPIPGLRPYYVDRFKEYANEKCLGDFWGDAADLPFRSHSLDYVATSHVLEHAANPVAAIFEWARVTRHGGILYMVVPDRRFTFDWRRDLTPPEHMIEDFEKRVTNSDGTHIAEYLDRIDWPRMNPTASAEESAAAVAHLRVEYPKAVAKGGEINIHFHVFEPSNLVALVSLMNRHPRRPAHLEILDTAERFPDGRLDGFLMVLGVRKGMAGRIGSWREGRRSGADPARALSAAARPLFV